VAITHRQRARRRFDVVSVVSRVWRVQVGLVCVDGEKVEVEAEKKKRTKKHRNWRIRRPRP